MAEPLKNQYGPEIPRKIADMIAAVHPTFDTNAFIQQALDGYEELELKPRAAHIAHALHTHLPGEYEEAIEVLISSLGPRLERTDEFGMAVFLYLPHVIYVAEYGLDHFEPSMRAQYELTQRFSAEFSLRFYVERHPKATMERLKEWVNDPNPHVRRLVSEGTRTRLPWAPRLRMFQKDPEPVIMLLELLRDDPELYVRRSVANNLNDIWKDNPERMVDVCQDWMQGASEERQWLIRHALRSAVKQGHRRALDILGYGSADDLEVQQIEVSPAAARIGESVRIAFDVHNTSNTLQRVMADFRIHYIKANGSANPKVFKLKAVELQGGETVRLEKKVSLREMTTRKHYPGLHSVDAVLNGAIHPLGAFELSS